jgi:hypothetical protein
MTIIEFHRFCDNLPSNSYGCVSYPTDTPGRGPSVTIVSNARGSTRCAVSRLVLERKLGRCIQHGHFSDHSCGNVRCVNPAHIFEGRGVRSYEPAQKTG